MTAPRLFLLWLFLLIPALLQAQYQRVISLAPSLTEMVYSLGAQDRLIAVTRYCDYPADATNKTRIGGILDVDLEKIYLLKPDLVLASYSGNSRETAEKLTKMGIKVVLFKEQSLDDILTNVRDLGLLLGIDPRVPLQRLTEKSKQLTINRAGPRTLLLLSISPFYSVSTNSFLGNALERAGCVNVLRMSTPYPQLDREAILTHHPDLLVLMESLRPREAELRKILKSLGLSPRLIYVDEDSMSRPGPRIFDTLIRLKGEVGK